MAEVNILCWTAGLPYCAQSLFRCTGTTDQTSSLLVACLNSLARVKPHALPLQLEMKLLQHALASRQARSLAQKLSSTVVVSGVWSVMAK